MSKSGCWNGIFIDIVRFHGLIKFLTEEYIDWENLNFDERLNL